MKALVVYGSKHGSTREISERISRTLSEEGLPAYATDANGLVETLEGFDAVVVGSAVRTRSWLRSPLRFILSNQDKLRNKQVWLFSCGLLADDPRFDMPQGTAQDRESHRAPGAPILQRLTRHWESRSGP
ncbi:MAG: flavodoxin domain-containing protein [Methanomassiliicoccales archaeon]